MGAIAIRDGRPEEIHHLAVLAQASTPGDIVAAGGAIESGRLEGKLGTDRLFVAECDGRVAGYAAVGEADGALLLDWVEGYGVSRGLRCVRVPAEGTDTRAREFYLRRGYVQAGAAIERELA